MFLRYKIWQDVLAVSAESFSGWENQFTLPFPCIDIRFMLIGYGWKPDSTTQNIPDLYQGAYKCYYRKVGDTDWTLFSTPISKRASTDAEYVYEDIVVDTGIIPEELYEVKVVASDGNRYESWGGAIEGVNKNHSFFYDIEYRGDKPLELSVIDYASVSDWSYGGKEIIEILLYEDIIYLDIMSNYNIGYQLEAVDDFVYIQEALNFLTTTYRQVFDVVWVDEYITFFSPIINLYSPIENIPIEEALSFEWDAFNLAVFQLITAQDIIVIGLSIVDMLAITNILVTEYYYIWVENLLQPNVSENTIAVAEYFNLYLQAYLSPFKVEEIFITENVHVIRGQQLDIPVQYELIPTADVLVNMEVTIVPEVSVFDAISTSEDFAYFIQNELFLSVNEDVSIAEDVSMFVFYHTLYADVFDTATITEDISAGTQWNLFAYDDISVIEYATVFDIIVELEAFEEVTIIEVNNVEVEIPKIDVSENINVQESAYWTSGLYFADVFDSVAIDEWGFATSQIYVEELLTVSEDASVVLPILNINNFENISVIDYFMTGLEIFNDRVVFLAHFDGVDASQVAPDESRWDAQPIFIDGTLQAPLNKVELDTTYYVFGTASLKCPPRSNYGTNKPHLKYNNQLGFDLGYDDFFLEFRWMRPTSWGGTNDWWIALEMKGDVMDWDIRLQNVGSGIIAMRVFNIGIYGHTIEMALSTPEKALWTWHTFALIRKDNKFRAICDGNIKDIQIGGELSTGGWLEYVADLGQSGSRLIIGGRESYDYTQFDGWLDEMIIVKGDHVYDDEYLYSVRTSPYPNPRPIQDRLNPVSVSEFISAIVATEGDIFVPEWIGTSSFAEAHLDVLANLFTVDGNTVDVTEFVNFGFTLLNLSVFDTVAITEYIVPQDIIIELGIVSDDISIAEDLTIEKVVVDLDLFETISIEESVSLSIPDITLSFSVFEDMTSTVDEFFEGIIATPAFSYDDLTLSEYGEAFIGELYINRLVPSNIVLLLHLDGINNSTKQGDYSSYKHQITFQNGAYLDTSDKVFGASSLNVTSAWDSCIVTSASSVFGIGNSSASTLEFRVKTYSGFHRMFEFYKDSNNRLYGILAPTYITIGGTSGGSFLAFRQIALTWTADAWITIGIQFFSRQFRVHIDGIYKGTSTAWGYDPPSGSGYVFRIGAVVQSEGGSQGILGLIDEVMFDNTQNLWGTNNYTPKRWDEEVLRESITITENAIVAIPIQTDIDVFDSFTIIEYSDFSLLSLPNELDVYDNLNIVEDFNSSLITAPTPSIYDDISTLENLDIEMIIPIYINLDDTISITENIEVPPLPYSGAETNAVLTLHYEGTDGSQTVVDSAKGRSVNSFGTGFEIDTAQYKVGTSAGKFDGTANGYFTYADSTDWDIGSGNYTIHCWVKHNSHTNSSQSYVQHYTDANNRWQFHNDESGSGLRWADTKANSPYIICNGTTYISDTNWHHVLFCKVGYVYAIYLDGQQIGYTYEDTKICLESGLLYIGKFGLVDSRFYFDGWMDELVISKSNLLNLSPNAGKTDTFTPPARKIDDFDWFNPITNDVSSITEDAVLTVV